MTIVAGNSIELFLYALLVRCHGLIFRELFSTGKLAIGIELQFNTHFEHNLKVFCPSLKIF